VPTRKRRFERSSLMWTRLPAATALMYPRAISFPASCRGTHSWRLYRQTTSGKSRAQRTPEPGKTVSCLPPSIQALCRSGPCGTEPGRLSCCCRARPRRRSRRRRPLRRACNARVVPTGNRPSWQAAAPPGGRPRPA